MRTSKIITDCGDLSELCTRVKALALDGNFSECEALITQAMRLYPHAPQPHNLFGIILEMEGDHFEAMKHFRAACALEPTYKPSSENLDINGYGRRRGRYAFCEADCDAQASVAYEVVYDKRGIGRILKEY